MNKPKRIRLIPRVSVNGATYHSDEFKERLIREFQESNLSMSAFAKQYSISKQLFHNWLNPKSQAGKRVGREKLSVKIKELEKRVSRLEKIIARRI